MRSRDLSKAACMRKEMRQGARLWWVAGLWLGCLCAPARLDAAAGRADWPVRMTVEITWSRPELPELPAGGPGPQAGPFSLGLEVSEGRVLDAVTVADTDGTELVPRCAGEGSPWQLGHAPRGKVRARVEAPLSSVLILREGSRATAFPISRLLEAPQQTLAGAPTEIKVARLGWDVLELDLGTGDGKAAPGSVIPVTVGFNVLTPEPSEALLRLVGELRPLGIAGDAVAWTCDQTQVVATSAAVRRSSS